MILKQWSLKRKEASKRLFNTKGSTAIEFAIVAPVFLLLLIGAFEVGAIMLVKTTLETAVYQVSRFGRTGSSVAGQTPQQVAVSLADEYSFGIVNASNLVLTVTPYASFSAMPTLNAAPNTGVQNFGTANQAVLYTLSYNWNFFTPLVGKYLSPNGTSITLTASAIVENEPF